MNNWVLSDVPVPQASRPLLPVTAAMPPRHHHPFVCPLPVCLRVCVEPTAHGRDGDSWLRACCWRGCCGRAGGGEPCSPSNLCSSVLAVVCRGGWRLVCRGGWRWMLGAVSGWCRKDSVWIRSALQALTESWSAERSQCSVVCSWRASLSRKLLCCPSKQHLVQLGENSTSQSGENGASSRWVKTVPHADG